MLPKPDGLKAMRFSPQPEFGRLNRECVGIATNPKSAIDPPFRSFRNWKSAQSSWLEFATYEQMREMSIREHVPQIRALPIWKQAHDAIGLGESIWRAARISNPPHAASHGRELGT